MSVLYRAFKNHFHDFRFGGVIPWFTAPYNALITLLGIAIVFIFFYYTCKVNYRRTSPYLATWKVHLLSALNGLGMVIVATLGFMAVYWWMWDLSDQSFLLTACCGIVGALLALSLCYYNILPVISEIVRRFTINYIVKPVRSLF